MLDNLSILKISTALAQHAAQGHATVGANLSRIDMPGATAERIASFADYVKEGAAAGPRISDTGLPISLDGQMRDMALHGSQHQAAVTVWSKTLDLFRLAGASPR